MKKPDFEDYICRFFCAYYRAGDKEDQACQAALVVAQLVRRGRLAIEACSRGTFEIPPPPHVTQLDQRVCAVCPFRETDCDFQAVPPVADSPPCGGYLLLALLIQRHTLTTTDLTAAGHV